jgi:hypothetical protein
MDLHGWPVRNWQANGRSRRRHAPEARLVLNAEHPGLASPPRGRERVKKSDCRGGPCGHPRATTRVAPTSPHQKVVVSCVRRAQERGGIELSGTARRARKLRISATTRRSRNQNEVLRVLIAFKPSTRRTRRISVNSVFHLYHGHKAHGEEKAFPELQRPRTGATGGWRIRGCPKKMLK